MLKEKQYKECFNKVKRSQKNIFSDNRDGKWH